LSLRDLARAAGIAEDDEELLALLLAEEGVELEEAAAPLERRRETGPAPLSFAQERLWFIDRLNPGSPVYNMPTALRLRGAFRPAVLAACLREILRRHESLRTHFEEREGIPRQVIEPVPQGFTVPLVDLSGLPPAVGRRAGHRLAREEARRPFDLARGPLLRATLLRLDGPAGSDHTEEEHAVLLTLHHIVSDGWSMGVLTREVATLYGAFAAGRPSPLPEPAIQYADFAAWQRALLQGEALEAELDHWRRQLAGAPTLELPADRPRPTRPTFRGGVRPFQLPQAASRALQDLTQREGATPFMTLLAGVDALLYRYTGQTDLVVGSMIANRNRHEIEGLIGFFVNALALRVDLAGDPTFRQLLGRTREASLAAFSHQDLPFEKLVAEIQPDRDHGRSPLFQVVLLVQNTPTGGGLELPGLSLRGFDPGEENQEEGAPLAKFDLLITAVEGPHGISGSLSYAAELFEAATMARFAEHLAILLAGAAADPDRCLSRLPMLSAGERHQLTVEWARTGSAALARSDSIPAWFAEQVRRSPEAPAVEGEDGALTYAELDRRARGLAYRLLARGLKPEQPVALCLERSVAQVVATLAVLQAGGVYLPLDPALPDERLALLLEDAGRALGRPLVLVRAAEVERFSRLLGTGWTVLALPPLDATPDGELDGEPGGEAAAAVTFPLPLAGEGQGEGRADQILSADRLAYVMYTSGSTGLPKGVAVPHRAVLRLVRQSWWAALGPDEVFLQLAPASFDAATLEIWAPLLNGGRLVVFPSHAPSLEELGEVVARRGVTTLWLTAGLFHQMVEGHLRGLAPLRQLLAGGDVLSPAHVDRVLRELPHLRLINGYGPTENTTFTCCWPVARETREPGAAVPIGRPIGNTCVRLLDRHGNPVPAGIHGELWAGGDGLARGYLGRTDLTAERFAPGEGERLYRTGDLARFRPDGVVEFLGRVDQQVKIRGFRIEPGEIEAAVLAHPAVGQAAVLAQDDGPGGKRLVAYVAARSREAVPDPVELRGFLRGRLPDYMVPAAWVLLDELPLNANGKVDRRSLAALAALAANTAAPAPSPGDGAAEAPRTPVEELVAGIWCEVLQRERVGVADDFFELGGHSLLATRLVSMLRQVFAVELPVRAVFEAPTLAALAREVEQALADGAGLAAPPIVPVGRDRHLPLSFAQERLWFLAQLEPESAAYNVPSVLRFNGPLDAGALAGALTAVVERHEALRTTFAQADGGPVQVIAPPGPVAWPLVDLAALPGRRREQTARRLASTEAVRPFDLARGPLLRPLLLRLDPRSHVAVLNLHHVVTDGWSMGILVRELGGAYAALCRGERPRWPALAVQYADFAVWQRAWLAGEVLAAQLAYWRDRLAGAPALLDLPTDRPRPAVQTVRGDAVTFALPEGLSGRLLALGRTHGVTLFMTLLAAWQALLARYSGQEAVVVGSPVANRNRAEIEPLIGFFVNTLALRVDLGGEPAFLDLLARAREATLGAYAHQDLPFERLVEELQPERSLGHSPLFQVMLALQNAPSSGLDLPGAGADPLELTAAEPDGVTAKFDLSLACGETPRGLRGSLVFNRGLFDRATAERWTAHLTTLLAAVVEAPAAAVFDVPLMTPAESAQVLVEWNQTAAVTLPHGCLHRWVEEQAARTPEAVAVIDPDGRWSYRRLDEQANRVAHLLRSLGVGPETLVAVCAGRSAALVAALLGVLKAGGAYVGLEPRYPRERLAFMLDDARARVLLTEQRFEALLPEHKIPTVRLDADRDLIERQSSRRPERVGVTPQNLAYLIYTSGSTGRPKGVAIAHHSAAVLVGWAGGVFPAETLAGVLAATSICFDLSVFELFVPLAHGGAVIVAEDALALPSHPAAAEVTLVNTVPSALAELVRQRALPPSVRTVNLAGEALQRELVEAIYRGSAVGEVRNLYGPSEDTTYSTWTLVEKGGRRQPAIGRPVARTRVYLVDRRLRPVPLGVAGELLLGGEGLARGYFGRPELTAERFVPDPLTNIPGERLYRTGDLARYRPDGDLEYLGRIDHQVKVRGFRIELGEIEAALLALPEVREAAVLAREDHPGERTLVAYVVPAAPITPIEPGAAEPPAAPAGDLAARLRRNLPDFMVPSFFVPLAALPLTPNGKLDRKALPRPERPLAAGDDEPPRTPVEEVLAEIWADLLRLDPESRGRVGLRANFFALGGHSLLATRLASRLREAFGVELPLRRLFEAPTLAGQAAEIEAARRAGGPPPPAMQPVPRDRPLPLSFAQERLWFLDQFEPGRAAYNIPTALRFGGPLDLPRLAASFTEVARRHEALRTTFAVAEGRAVQVVAPALGLRLPLIDLSLLPDAAREREAARLAAQESWRAFDLAAGPLVRGSVLRLAAADHAVLFAMHHIVSDGWSMGILVREVATIYAALHHGRPSPLPPLPVQYPDFAAWQRGWLAGDVLAGQIAWWNARLAGAPPVIDLPFDRARPPVHRLRGERRARRLAAQPARALAELGRRGGATLFMVLLAAWKAFLLRHTGQRDLVVGTPIANRTRAEVEGLIGFFVNTLVLRTEIPAGATFDELLALVRETALGAYDHQDVPFEKLVEELAPERNLRHTPLFQVMFVFEEGAADRGAPPPLPDLTMRPLTFENRTAKFDLTLIVQREAGGLQLLLGYNTDLFRRDSIDRMLDHLVHLLEGVAAVPASKVVELPLLDGAERHQLIAEWNDTAGAVPVGLLHSQFEDWARRRPEAPALVFGDEQLSYGDLAARSEELAAALRGLGVGPEVRVGLCLERSFELFVGLLGVLRAGGAYVPLDPANPAERLRFQVEDARAPVLLTQRSLAASLQVGHEAAVTVVCLDEPLPRPAGLGEPLAGPHPDPDGLAYVIYTSGSTGTPNGVLVPHRGAVNLIREARELYQVGPESRILQTASVGFDASVLEIFLALSHGGSLCLVREEERLTPSVLTKRLVEQGVSTAVVTPSLLSVLPEESLAVLRSVSVGGEACSAELAGRWARGGRRLLNCYGPTEATIFATVEVLENHSENAGEVEPLIGRPISNMQAYVVDAQLAPMPAGVAGELVLGGVGLARGYLDRPERTAEKLVPNVFSEEAGARLYRTGDLVRRRADGRLEFLGRIDDQVKVRGFRIELGEVEAGLLAHPDIAQAVVLAPPDKTGARRLVAYVAAQEGRELSASDLRRFLESTLPEYMVPAHVLVLDALPVTPGGKVDRRSLPNPDGDPQSGRAYVAPRTAAERFVAQLWQQVLGMERVGALDDFFGLGGSSIKGALLTNLLQERLGEYVYVVALFDAPTVEKLAAYLLKTYPEAMARVTGMRIEERRDERRVDAGMLIELREIIQPLSPHPDKESAKNARAAFILSPPRSGSTLLRVMLAGNPNLFAPPELELLGFNTLRERKSVFTGRWELWTEGTIRALMEVFDCDADEAKQRMEEHEARGLTIQQFYRYLQDAIGSRLLVDKTPSYSLDTATLQRAEDDFDRPLYVHLLRHPHGMIRSFEKARLEQVFFRPEHSFSRRQLAELIYDVCHENIFDLLSRVAPERHLQVRFEDMVRDPRGQMERLCGFLGVPFDERMLDPYADSERKMTDGIHALSKMVGDVKFHEHKAVDAGVADSWRSEVTEDFLGDVTWDLAQRLGYASEKAEEPAARARFSPLVRLQAGEPGRGPLFLVHPVGGNVLCYAELARSLGPEQPVYGLQSLGLGEGQQPEQRVEDMAATYLAALRDLQPHGPYRLGGWSIGGVIAYEMAGQLRRAGEEVELLALLDTLAPTAPAGETAEIDEAELLAALARDLGGLAGQDLRLTPAELRAIPEEDGDRRLRHVLERAQATGALAGVGLEPLRRLWEVFRANALAVRRYDAAPTAGPVLLFAASANPLKARRGDSLGWDRLAGDGLELERLDAAHYTLLRPPAVQALAAALRGRLAGG
jgi:amino acid adenylation domain-containing protein